mgnify:FL=1
MDPLTNNTSPKNVQALSTQLLITWKHYEENENYRIERDELVINEK